MQTAKQNNPNRPTVVGITGIEGEYAAAVAYPFGERPHYIYLQRTAGTWQVLMATAIPSSNALQQAGVPASLGSSSDADLLIGGFVGTYAEQMQPPRTTGLEGTVVVEGQIGDYARLFFTPADPATVDPLTAFWQRKDGRWQQLTAGSGFDEAMLQQFGIPPQLWKKPLY